MGKEFANMSKVAGAMVFAQRQAADMILPPA
jgi:hypothetical protein